MRSPLILGFDGCFLSKETTNLWKQIKPLGTILFQKNIKNKEQLKELISQIKNFDPEILIVIDYEGGVVNRFSEDIPVIASTKSMGRTFHWENIEQAVRFMAETLNYFGFHINLAPVLDFEGKLSSPAIQDRGFYPDNQLISEYNKIFVEQHTELGVYCVGKHFPGLYKVSQDPHKEESSFAGTTDDLELSVSCYQDLFTQESQGVMSSHIFYPELDEENPATFSKKIIQSYLKDKLGFKGLVFSDCLEMKGIADKMSPEMIAKKTLAAGHDILISCYQFKKDMAFQQALANGIKDYFEDAPELGEKHQKKITPWHKKQLESEVKVEKLPSNKEVIKINRSFIDKRIFKQMSEIDSFVIFTTEKEKNEKSISKALQKLPQFFGQQKIQENIELKEKMLKGQSLVFILDKQPTEELLGFMTSLVKLAKQSLVISISFQLASNLPIGEQWILWGKNHSVVDSLVDAFQAKCSSENAL